MPQSAWPDRLAHGSAIGAFICSERRSEHMVRLEVIGCVYGHVQVRGWRTCSYQYISCLLKSIEAKLLKLLLLLFESGWPENVRYSMGIVVVMRKYWKNPYDGNLIGIVFILLLFLRFPYKYADSVFYDLVLWELQMGLIYGILASGLLVEILSIQYDAYVIWCWVPMCLS